MHYNIDEVMNYIEEEDAKFIRLAFRDAYGIQKNISVMPGEIPKAFQQGIPFNPRSIAGFEHCPNAMLYLKPDPSTLTVLPWRPDSGRVLRMYCDVIAADGGPYCTDTRWILKKAVEKARGAGIEFRFGAEMEFYLFKKDEEGNATSIPYDQGGYMDVAPLDRCENVRREICLMIEKMGLRPERSHHERGPGQNEIDFHYGKPLLAADQMSTFRLVVSTLADRYGLVSDFSPLPLPGYPGNGYHINIYAADSKGNDVGKYAAAGILKRISEMTLFLNPTNASYERLGNHAAPDKANWGSRGDSELLFITEDTGRTHAELRSPDASGNPYLIYALLIYAGLEGVEEKMVLPEAMSEDSRLLPGSLKEAGQIARESAFIQGILPAELIEQYSKIG